MLTDLSFASFAEPSDTLTCDRGAADDTARGALHLTPVCTFDELLQYLPLVITCPENDATGVLSLPHGTAPASLGADNDLRYPATRTRTVRPHVRARVGGDGGLGNRSDAINTSGRSTNAVSQRERDALLAGPVGRWDEPHESPRPFAAFWYRPGTWAGPRWVVVEAEANEQGTNRRFVTASRAGARGGTRKRPATNTRFAARAGTATRSSNAGSTWTG